MKTIVFIIDPIESLHAQKDTSLALMAAAHDLDNKVAYAYRDGLHIIDGLLYLDVVFLDEISLEGPAYKTQEMKTVASSQIDVIWMRLDPPFDERYLTLTWCLDHVALSTQVINHPRGLRTVNEKLWVTQFKEWTPDTIVTSKKHIFEAFITQHPKVVIKPSNGFGGAGVFLCEKDNPNAAVMFETTTQNGALPAIVQKAVPEAKKGDKRILLWKGDALGAVLRKNSANDHRHNFFAGGHAYAADITEHEHRIIAKLKPYLEELGLHFVGIDFLGDYLIEVNVTSPTCLQEMSYLSSKHLAADIIKDIMKKA